MDDRAEDGTWRFCTDRTNLDPACDGCLFGWAPGKPNNYGGSEECLNLWATLQLNDGGCSQKFHGICEIKVLDS